MSLTTEIQQDDVVRPSTPLLSPSTCALTPQLFTPTPMSTATDSDRDGSVGCTPTGSGSFTGFQATLAAHPFVPRCYPTLTPVSSTSIAYCSCHGSPKTPGSGRMYEMCMRLRGFGDIITGGNPEHHTPAQRLKYRKLLYTNISPRPALPFVERSPFSRRKPLLILDLDETLVHAHINVHAPRRQYDAELQITVNGATPTVHNIYVDYRPHLKNFLMEAARYYELAVFTAARPIYAATLLNVMDPKGTLIPKKNRKFREDCTIVYNSYMGSSVNSSLSGQENNNSSDGDASEELAIARAMGVNIHDTAAADDATRGMDPGLVRTKDILSYGRPLEEVLLVDNTPTCGLLQPRNLLPVRSWYADDFGDVSLLALLPVLRRIIQTGDIQGTLDAYCASLRRHVE